MIKFGLKCWQFWYKIYIAGHTKEKINRKDAKYAKKE
jgi:hypothetical protein